MNAVGMNTAQSTSAIAMIGPETSSIALRVASIGGRPMLDVPLDVFHHHDRVVDHDADREHEAEERERVEREPDSSITANVPTSDTGTATSGMIDARQVCRKTITTTTTSRMASNSVSTTARIDSRT